MSVTRLLVALLAAGVVAGGVVAVSAGGQGTTLLTLTVVTKDADGTFVDVPPRSKKFSSDGDRFIGRGTVNGGQGTVAYEYTFDGSNTFLRGVFSLPDGKLFFEEFDRAGAKLTRGAIVGGTGRYAGARGDFEDRTIKTTSSATTSRVQIALPG